MSAQHKCPISDDTMEPVFSEVLLGKYAVSYYYCKVCGFLNTENPYWLKEAYQEAISGSDTGLVQRNIANCAFLEGLLQLLFRGEGRYLDIAGGYGLLTRLLRDKGFDCYSTDKYCRNLLAGAFKPGKEFKADALFAFEVLEHIEDPLKFLSNAFREFDCRTLIFSTLTFKHPVPPRDWWYYMFDSGQHISFYQTHTLSLLAEKLGCLYYNINENLHLITDTGIHGIRRRVLLNRYLRRIYSLYARFKRRNLSKTWEDHLKIKENSDPSLTEKK